MATLLAAEGNRGTAPELAEAIKRSDGGSSKLASARTYRVLQRLTKEGLVRFVPYSFEARSATKPANLPVRGHPVTGSWVLTRIGTDYTSARLSIEVATRAKETLESTPFQSTHLVEHGVPSILLVNCGPMREHELARRLFTDGPLGHLRQAARLAALVVWAQNPALGNRPPDVIR
ncbi:MAG: hypothetical protein ACREDK_06985 [Thermoplasmata archaeon]